MIVTNEKIEVTYEMMERNNMTRGTQFGVPINPVDPSLGLRWKEITEMTELDFDNIEQYFINKQSR